MKSKLNKIAKLNSQTNLILKGEKTIKSNEKKKTQVNPGKSVESMTRDMISDNSIEKQS